MADAAVGDLDLDLLGLERAGVVFERLERLSFAEGRVGFNRVAHGCGRLRPERKTGRHRTYAGPPEVQTDAEPAYWFPSGQRIPFFTRHKTALIV